MEIEQPWEASAFTDDGVSNLESAAKKFGELIATKITAQAVKTNKTENIPMRAVRMRRRRCGERCVCLRAADGADRRCSRLSGCHWPSYSARRSGSDKT